MGNQGQRAWEEYKKQHYSSNTSTTQKTTASTNATQKATSSTNAGAAAWEKYKKEAGLTSSRQIATAQSWSDSSIAHIKDAESYLSKWHRKDDAGYASIQNKNKSLLEQAYFWRNEYAGDEEAKSYINEIISALKNVETASKEYFDHYGKWGTEDEYNTAKKNYEWQQKYKDSSIEDLQKLTLDDEEEQKWVESYIQYLDDEEKGNYDLIAGQKEIDELEAQLAQLEQNKRYEALQQRINPAKPTEPTRQDIGYNPHTMWQQGAVETAGITEEEKLRQLIAQKKQYLNQAKRIQESNAYADTVNNADFDQFDDFVESDDTLYNWVNDAQFRDSYESKFQRNGTQSKYGFNNYDRMNQNEIAIFNYYYAKGGKEAAQKYLDNIQETLNKRKAEEMFGIVKDDVALEMVFGAAAGVNQFGTNVMNNFKFKADYIPQSAYQIASGMVREDLADNGKLPEWLGGGSLGQVAYDAITTTANMAPSILVGMATGGTAGTALMGLSAAGGAYQQALNEGFDKAQARGYSILVGASEAVLEKVLGGISPVGGNAMGTNAVKNIANADNALKAIAKRIGGSLVSEFKEEYLQEVLDPLFRNLMMHTGEDVKLVSYEAIYSGILGALTGAFMEAPFAIYGETKTAITGRKIKEAGGVNDLAKIGNTFAPETVAYKLAGKVTNDTGAYTIGQLFNEVNARLTDQNISEIAEVLVENDVDERTARQYAEAFAYVVENGSMPDALANAIEADPLMAKAATKVLFEDNTTWNQRSQGYRDVLMKLAEDKVKGKTAPTSKASVPADNTAEAKTESGAEGNVEPAKYGSIQNIKNGKVTVKMTDGTEVDLKDADLDPEDSVRIETIASIDGISAEDASGIFGILKAGSKNSQYDAIGAREAYRYGYYGLTEKMLDENGTFSKSLTSEQRKAVYEIGNKARQQNVESKTFRKTDAKKDPGKVHYDGDRAVLNERQQVSLKAMDRIASALGVQIYIFESKVGENGKRIGENGWYDPADGSIHIDLYAGQSGEATMLFTLAHELTHYIRQWSPQKFKALADFLLEEYGKKGVNVSKLIREQQNKAKRNGRTISYDTAYEEVVADSMEMMLSDGNVMKRLEKLKAQDKDLWSQIKRFIDDMADKIRAVYKGLSPDSREANLVKEMGDTIYHLQELFAEGLMDASENFQSAEKNTTDDGGVKMMVRENVVDVNGKKYDKVIKPGLTVYESVKHKRKDYISHLRKKIFKRTFTVDDIDGEQIPIEFAKDGETVQKDGANNPHPVLGELEAVTDRLKMIAIINIKDLIKNSKPLTPSSENSHQWLDEGGWRDRISYMTDFDVIYPVILHIPKTRDGRHLLYDISVLKKEGTSIDMDATALAAQSARAPENTENGFQSAVEVLEPSVERLTQPEAKVNNKSTKAMDLEVDEKTESVAPAILKSERTWTESDYVQERDAAAKEIAKAIGVSEKKAKAYIDSVNSIAKMIADDRTRLDYFSSPNRSSFVSNVEYGGSFDFSTLCKKRRLLTGTFTAIQKALPNTALTANEILDIRNRMKEAGLEVSCGLCYVEGSRANMGQFAKEFLRLYKQYYPDAWQPNMADVNTPDGIEWVRINHPECYEQYEYFWNHYGTLKAGDKNLFASQQKPKLYQLHTEYKGEILKKFKDDDNVEEKNLNGGIRLQSFSDFEIVHLIDTMQIIMDMSRVGLAGQAYTKVPDFAWALGDTGLKINLSLIAKGVDENGKLIFDDVEGMPIADAMKLRDRYSANVGTILVAFNDEQLKAAMADDRVDFIIPFHRSQWKKSQYSAMGLPAKTKDYTFMQNEKFIKPQYHEYRGRMVKDKATNYMPNEYWDFSKSGKENAEAYLEMCARNNKRPKFYKLLENNGDGSYSLKSDGSTDGYWKLLIDFKMYDNAGNGSPQQAVKPEFNMDEATRMLNEYSGGHSNFPVAQGIVDEFVSEYKDSHKGVLYSGRDSDGNELTKSQEKFFKDSKVRDRNGNLKVMYHGTNKEFTIFDREKLQDALGFFFTDDKWEAADYGKPQKYYVNIRKPFDITSGDLSDYLGDAPRYVNGKFNANAAVMGLIAAGYDGIYSYQKGSTWYIAFYPEQIKRVDNRRPSKNPDIRYSDRDTESVTARDLLSGTDVATIKNEVAKKKLSDYQKILEVMNTEDQKLREIRAEIKELSFAKGTRDTQKLKDLKFEAIKINNHISVYEGQLQRMEKELQSVVKRERAKVVKEAEKRDKAVLAKEWMDAQVKQNETLREYRETRAALRQQESDTAVMEKEFIRIAKEYEKLNAKSETAAGRSQRTISELKTAAVQNKGTISELRTALKNEAKKHRADERMWMAEFGRLMREYEAADRSIDRLEQKIERQKAVAKERVEGRNKTAMRHKIRKIVKDLDKILNRGNKKNNVKEDMKGFASKALELADYLFADHISNEDLIRKGITVRMTTEEAALVKETENILSQIYDNADNIADAEFNLLDSKRKRNLDKLRDLLAEQRNEYLDTPVYNLFNDLVTEYASLKNSTQDAVRSAYNPDIERFLRSYIGDSADGTDTDRKTLLQNMRVKDMTMDELWKIHNAYTMVLHSIRKANEMFVKGKAESVDEVTKAITWDFGSRKIPDKKAAIIARNLSNKIGWDYEKLYYALDRIGSEAFTELVMNVANSENTVMQDVMEAAAFRDQMVEQYGFNNWDVNKEIDREFLDTTGKKFKLTLGQMMALYAYSRREGAWDHIEYGGFVFGDAALTNPRPADAYKLSKEQCEAITNLLTEEQKGYVKSMQRFLSETMGEKGNEVSMLMYGIKMFNEKNYFPIHMAGQFKAQANESQAKAAAGFQSMSNAGFTHAQNPNAKAPFVLEGFNEVWVDHVNEMSRYHGTVPALEDMRRVMNRSTYSNSTESSVSIKQLMENSFGKEAVEYFDDFYREANAGAITDKLQKRSQKLLSLFRKNSVAYSLSVLIQQPTSITRAYAMIDPRYFGYKGVGAITGGVVKTAANKWTNAQTKAYNEMLKYAPGVTMAKEIGGFDTATGGSIRSYLLDTNKSFKQKWKTGTALEKGKAVMDLVDDNAVANLPNLADKIAWIEIWNACKRESLAKHTNLRPSSDELLQIAGKRFTEVIRATQVYDSMFAKSPMLKSKNLFVQSLVSFMNEPNTVANMAESAMRDFVRGDKKSGVRKAAVLVNSIIATGVLKSIVYAMRDDDEDETYIEKYVEALTGSLMDDFNLLNYIPIARDVWSLTQGYDVERADMAIVADAIEALGRVIKNASTETGSMTEEQLIEFDKQCTEANWKLAESLATFLGIPMKNIRREIMGILNLARTSSANKGLTTKTSLSDSAYNAVIDSIPFLNGKKTKEEKLYEARMNSDEQYASRLASSYKDEKAANSAVTEAIKNRYKNGKLDEATALKHLVLYAGKDGTEAHWTMDKWKYQTQKGTDEGYSKYYKIYEAIKNGESITEAVEEHISNGSKENEVMSEVKSSIGEWYRKGEITKKEATDMLTDYFDLDSDEIEATIQKWSSKVDTGIAYDDIKTEYMDGNITSAQAVDMYVKYGGYTKEDAEETIADYDFENEYGFAYGDRKEAYLDGKVSRSDLIDILVDHGYNEDDADAQVDVYEWQEEGLNDISIKAVQTYRTWAEPAGIPKAVYYSYWKFDNATENDRDPITGKTINGTAVKKIMAYINSLNLTDAQKDALAKCAGWKDSTIKKNKLW